MITVVENKTFSKGEKATQDIVSLLRARNSLIWVTSREEARVELFLIEAAAAAGYKPLFFDVDQGVTDAAGKKLPAFQDKTVEGTLAAIRTASDNATTKAERTVWVLRDLPKWLEGLGGATPLRALRNLAKHLPTVDRKSAQSIIILTTETKIPDDLAGHATVIDFPLPDRSEIKTTLDNAIKSLPEFEMDKETGEPIKDKPIRSLAVTPESYELAIDAAVGLTAEEASSCFAKSLVTTRVIDPAIIADEKKRVISREKVLEWVEPVEGGLGAIGGLDLMKEWIEDCKHAYSPEARAYGLRAPRGVVAVGVQGCGKSFLSKAIPGEWKVPCLRLDPGALKGKYVGESEGSIRKCIKVIEALGRCVVWIDEIEKALSGASEGAADGGVSSDQVGVLLNWLQERKNEAFVIVTANDVTKLPPELLRQGRFDEVFFFDLPNAAERKGVIKASLTANGQADLKINYARVAEVTNDFASVEIAELVQTAMRKAFKDGGRRIKTDDIVEVASKVVPLVKRAGPKVNAIREWGKANARPASSPDVTEAGNTSRQIELA